MIWPVATNPILSLLFWTLFRKVGSHFVDLKFSRSYDYPRRVPFVCTNHGQKYESGRSPKKILEKKLVIHQTWLQINIFSLFRKKKKRKKEENGCRCVDRIQLVFVASSFARFHLLERLLKVHANDYSPLLTLRFFDEKRAFWIRCNFVFHETFFFSSPPLLFLAEFQRNICNNVENRAVTTEFFFVERIVEIYRRGDESSWRDKIPAPDISSRSRFVCLVQGAWIFKRSEEAITSVDKAWNMIADRGIGGNDDR